ncbi:Putative osmoprotectant uptake system permease protein yehY [Yokenella regensburgei]|nr:Putative osmoprotectant uptake system permease protein yehY [Yokenella regensburgei]
MLLVVIAIAAAALPFVNYAPNRLVSGEGRSLWDIFSFNPVILLVAPIVFLLLTLSAERWATGLTLLLAELLFIALFWGAGRRQRCLQSQEHRLRERRQEVVCGYGWHCFYCWGTRRFAG